MITNPSSAAPLVNIEPGDEDFLDKRGRIRVKRLTKYDDPQRFDRDFERVVQEVQANVVGLDIKVIEGGRVRHYTDAAAYLSSRPVQRRLQEARERGLIGADEVDMAKRKSLQYQMQGRVLKEGSDFEYGMYSDEVQTSGSTTTRFFPVSDVVLPTLGSPHAKNALRVDYLDAHRKSWSAATFNPLAKRICLSGDTTIPLLDGTNPTLRELAARGEQEVWVYANHNGQVVPARTSCIALTGYRPVLAVALDNGEVVKATADHPFMLRDGTYREAGALRVGDRLMPLYRRNGANRKPLFYEQVWHPDLGLWEFTHRLVARTVLGRQKDTPSERGLHVHHLNDVSSDNRPGNLQLMSQVEHVTETSRREKNREIKRRLPQSRNFGQTIKAKWADPEWRARQQQKFRDAADPARLARRAKAMWADPEKRERMVAGMKARPTHTDPKTGRFLPKNHRVVSVTPAGSEPVYDLTVPDFENFAVGQGVFVHNCKIIPQFCLGRGVKGAIAHVEHQRVWNEFWRRNRMRGRTKQSLKELVMFGEIFWRFFNTKQGLIVRSIDPSTIWDIVTNEDDIEDVKYYHQQYTRIDVNPLPGQITTPATVVIRQIPADQVAHYKINATSSEKRGRSELFPILGYLLRFKEFVDDRIAINKLRSMVAMDVSVEGDEAAVRSANDQFNEPPGPSAVLVHNKAVEVQFLNTGTGSSDASTDADTILKVIAVGAGVSEQFLGVSKSQTRAGALISTEPDVKNFEDYQELIEEILMDTSDRVFEAARLSPEVMEFTFPSIAQEDRSAKLKDIAFAESMDYFSKERAATMAGREFQISDYNHETEKQTISKERAESPVMALGLQQMPKVTVDPTAAPGMMGADLSPGGGVLTPNTKKVTQTSAQMGFKADGGGRGLANTQATLNRSGFTRGGERTALKNNRSSGTPLRHSVADGAKTSGWTTAAREKSLAVRRARAEMRKREQQDA